MTDTLQNSALTRANVGCGATPTPGWINFDNSWTVRAANNPALRGAMKAAGQFRGREAFLAAVDTHGIRWANAAAHIPVPDASLTVVYTSHMVEHLFADEARGFLAEAKRVLMPGGRIRIAVPDIAWHVSQYAEHRDADRFIEELYMAPAPVRGISGTVRKLLIGERHHCWMYDGPSLCRLLTAEGFAKAEVFPAGETGIADPGELDLAERAPESVFVEAVRV